MDYNLPERFNLEYIGADNSAHRPVMIHRAPFGSMERFVGVLIEHCSGNFPLWLTPDQYAILPISDRFNEHAQELKNQLSTLSLRGFVDDRSETIGKKIRDNELKKIPFLLIIGEKEIANNTISLREHGKGDLGSITIKDFADKINAMIG